MCFYPLIEVILAVVKLLRLRLPHELHVNLGVKLPTMGQLQLKYKHKHKPFKNKCDALPSAIWEKTMNRKLVTANDCNGVTSTDVS